MKKAMLIINPFAGKQQLKSKIFDIKDILSQHDYQVTIFPTRGKYDATFMVKLNLPDYDLVVCCGGDGTLNEVITGMMAHEKRPPLGFIPTGTTNDISKSLGIAKNPIKAAEAIVEGHTFAYDIGAFNQELYFDYVAAFGLFSDISYTTSQQMKTSLGYLAYVLEFMKTFTRYPVYTKIPSYHMRIDYDGLVLEEDFIFGAITNSTSMGGLFKYNQNYVKLDDGLFEMLLVRSPKNAVHLSSIITDVLRKNYDTEDVMLLHASKMDISCIDEVTWCLDGENGGMWRDVSIVNCPRSIRFFVSEATKNQMR